jgi:hypothetical protein
MKYPLEPKLMTYPRAYLTDSEMRSLLKGSQDSRYSKVKRWLASGKLLHIRRGLYYLTEQSGHLTKPHPFELAHFIYAPSYISFESALSYHGFIPEAVYSITCACTKRNKAFETPLGKFNYLKLPVKNFYIAVELMTEGSYHFFMAKPWKAICDYIVCYKKEWRSIDPLIKSLRIQWEDFPGITYEEIELLDEYYHHKRMTRFLKSIKQGDKCER